MCNTFIQHSRHSCSCFDTTCPHLAGKAPPSFRAGSERLPSPQVDWRSAPNAALCWQRGGWFLSSPSHLHSLSEPQGTLLRLAAAVTRWTMACSFRHFASRVSLSVISFMPISWPVGGGEQSSDVSCCSSSPSSQKKNQAVIMNNCT